MFYGQYNLTLDQKGRITLPRLIRDGITQGNLVVREGFEPVLYLYDRPLWEAQAQSYLVVPIENEAARQKRREVFSNAQVVKVDDQGRITIPQRFLSFAQISETTGFVLLGAGDHFELWEQKLWEHYGNEPD